MGVCHVRLLVSTAKDPTITIIITARATANSVVELLGICMVVPGPGFCAV